MTNCCSFGLLCVSFVNVCICECGSFPFGFEGGLWDSFTF